MGQARGDSKEPALERDGTCLEHENTYKERLHTRLGSFGERLIRAATEGGVKQVNASSGEK